jgi:hypothetical protein
VFLKRITSLLKQKGRRRHFFHKKKGKRKRMIQTTFKHFPSWTQQNQISSQTDRRMKILCESDNVEHKKIKLSTSIQSEVGSHPRCRSRIESLVFDLEEPGNQSEK